MTLRALLTVIAAAAVAATAAAITLTARVLPRAPGAFTPAAPAGTAPAGTAPAGTVPAGTAPAGTAPAGPCARLAVPAYFAPQEWARTARTRPPPGEMILDISGVGAGTAPSAEFRALAGQARAAGVTVLGYVSTVDGQRPLAADQAEVRNYAAWYGVRSVFLDRVSGASAQLGYYRRLAAFIRRADPGGQLWLNPGIYPDRGYMSLGGTVMTFEGTYAQYRAAVVPAWARDYPASVFAHTVYAASRADLAPALRLARARDAGHVYITDGTGANPYQALPGYWAAEAAAACRPGGGP